MSIAAVVLAAGASTRMGRPKALIEWRGRPFYESCVALADAVGCEPVVVVDGAQRLASPTDDAFVLVHNPGWERGPLSSLQVGLRAALERSTTAALVLSVDRPHVRVQTVAALVRAHADRPEAFVQPSWRGQRGHPVLYPRALVEALLALPPTDTPRAVVRRPDVVKGRVVVPLDDPAVTDNIDTPGALEELPP